VEAGMKAAARRPHDVQYTEYRTLFQVHQDSCIAPAAFHTRPVIPGALRSRCVVQQFYSSRCLIQPTVISTLHLLFIILTLSSRQTIQRNPFIPYGRLRAQNPRHRPESNPRSSRSAPILEYPDPITPAHRYSRKIIYSHSLSQNHHRNLVTRNAVSRCALMLSPSDHGASKIEVAACGTRNSNKRSLQSWIIDSTALRNRKWRKGR
jgi:hypothetical protein